MEKEERIAIGERIKNYMNQNNLTPKECIIRLGINQPSFSKKVNGELDPTELAIMMSREFGASLEYLINGECINLDCKKENTTSNFQHANTNMLPEVSFSFAAGQKQLVNGRENVNRYWYLPDCTDCDAVVPIEGDSMSPNIPPGSFAVLKRFHITANNPNSIPFGQVFGIVLEDEATGDYHGYVKVLRKHKDAEQAKKCWIAHSYNPDYDDFDIHLSQVRSLWIVKQYVVSSMAY